MNRIKLFVWNQFIERFFKDWLDEYAQEASEQYEEDREPMWSDLD